MTESAFISLNYVFGQTIYYYFKAVNIQPTRTMINKIYNSMTFGTLSCHCVPEYGCLPLNNLGEEGFFPRPSSKVFFLFVLHVVGAFCIVREQHVFHKRIRENSIFYCIEIPLVFPQNRV